MDVAAIMKDVASWPTESQIELLEGIRVLLANQRPEPGFPPEHATELNRRLDDLDASPGNFLTWDQLLEKVKPTR